MNDFVVVANRLPVDKADDGTWVPSPGGLVAALSPVLARHKGCWVGWPGAIDDAPVPFRSDDGTLLYPVSLSAEDFEGFYEGFSNATLWPLYHDLIVTPQYHRQWWPPYKEVNQRFAEAVAEVAAEGATVWVQDYQLQLVPGILARLRPDVTIGFFLHIPFPHPDLFRQLPWRNEILDGLAGADLLGFHTDASAANFAALAPHARVGTFPISIDPASLSDAGSSTIAGSVDAAYTVDAADTAALRRELGSPSTIFLGVDRLDYTKGILQRLRAFEELLESGSLDPNGVAFVQIATPSRERIDHYRRTRSVVEEAVGRINGRFGTIGRPIVHYQHSVVDKGRLHALYKAADVMVVTPYKDGMNLVAKEYVASHSDGTGALVLSEFAGAAEELTQAYLCNPFDIESIKSALLMGTKPDPERMLAMHRQVLDNDVHKWAGSFLSALRKTES